MTGKSAKAKGRRLQDRLCDDIVATFPQLIRGKANSDDPCDIKPARIGEAGMDVKLLTPLARELFPYACEAKCRESVNIWKAILQAESNVKVGLTALVAIWRNLMPEPYIAIPLSKFLELVQKARAQTTPPNS
jgi:hypothetical protein